MNKYLRYILLASMIFLSFTVYGQKLWTLEECIKYAWENNLQIKQQEIAVEQSKNTLKQSQLSYFPSVSGSIGHNFNWGRSVDMQELIIIENKLTQATSASLSASLPVFNGFSKHNTIKSNKVQLNIANLNIEKLRNDISLNIAKAYLQLLLSKQIQQNTLVSFNSIEKQRERTAKLVEAGSQPYSSLLEIDAQVASERVQVVNANGQVETNTLTLVQMLDLPPAEKFDIVTPDLEMIVSKFQGESLENIYDVALKLPQVRSTQYALDNSKIQLSMAKGALYPSISISAGYGTYYSDAAEGAFKQQFNDNRNPSVGIGVSIPIFNGFQANTKVKNARLSVKNSEIDLKTKHQDIYKEIQSAVSEARNCYEKYLASEQNVRAMKESFRMAEQKFESGAINGTDYIISKTNMIKAESEYYQAKFQYIFQLKIIDYYKGIPIIL
ncbi:MAG: TolC family protein [Bacteroidales bacterium]